MPHAFARVLCLSVVLLPGSATAQSLFSLFVATREEVAARMVNLANLKKGDVVTDLGSGDGRLVIASAKSNPDVSGFGVDLNASLVREASARAWMESVNTQVKFYQQNVFDADLSKVDVIYMWLFPELQRLLRNKILREARPGTRIVTQMFDMGAWQPDAVDTVQPSVRMWIVPANIAGNWNWELALPGIAKNTYAAIIDQVFQNAVMFGHDQGLHTQARHLRRCSQRAKPIPNHTEAEQRHTKTTMHHYESEH